MDFLDLHLIHQRFHYVSVVTYSFISSFIICFELVDLAHFVFVIASVRHLEFVRE
jgi:hypothetical protein